MLDKGNAIVNDAGRDKVSSKNCDGLLKGGAGEVGATSTMGRTTEYEEDTVRQVIDEYMTLREERRPLELQWRLNMNFLRGNQYCEITQMGDIEDYGKQYFWQSREVFNHIAPIIETRLAKLARVKAMVSVRPISSDDSDIKAAQLSTQILRAITEENNMTALTNSASSWSEVCGSAFYKIVWDSGKGAILGKNSQGDNVHEGDVSVEVCPPYEIFPDDLSASGIDDCKYLIHARAYSRDDVMKNWGLEVGGSPVDVFSVTEAMNGGGLGYSATNIGRGIKSTEDKVVVLEKYERPTVDFPDGRLIVVAGDRLAYMGDMPFKIEIGGAAGIPFARQIAVDNVASFYGVSVVERIIPIQRAYNAIKNRKHEFLSRIAMGVLAVEDGSVDADGLEDEGLSPGKILVYRQGSTPPRMMEMGNVPNDFTIEEERLRQEFMQISGVSDLMRYSNLPTNVTSGVAIARLQEQDETRIITTAEHIRQAIKRIGQVILRLYKQYAINSRVKRLAGENGQLRLAYFKGSDLSCDDLVFDTDNELNETPASRRNMVFDLVKMGLLHDDNGKINARTRVKVLEMLGLGNWESAKDIDECHRDKALTENVEINNHDIEVSEFDNHGVHIAEHTKAIINMREDKAVENLLAEHIRQHKMLDSMEGIIKIEEDKNV